jgi:DNA adenine methylase
MKIIEKNTAKPFVKWAGGKSQLINEIDKAIQKSKKDKFTYIEPFVGGGAVLFWILENFPYLEKVVINDINTDLITTYKTIKNNVIELIRILKDWEKEYHTFKELPEDRKEYYYKKRELFNSRTEDNITHSALFIFLNRTCFNGLFRVNQNNGFNVPIGSYKTPMICDEGNLQSVYKALHKVEILNGDFSETIRFAANNTIFYLDPPYKPLSETSSFNSYSKDEFNDNEQIRLKEFCDKIDLLGHQWILSNSDVKGKNPHDEFFDDLYQKYNIFRVKARRNINANGEKRGELNELLITNQTNIEYVGAI